MVLTFWDFQSLYVHTNVYRDMYLKKQYTAKDTIYRISAIVF